MRCQLVPAGNIKVLKVAWWQGMMNEPQEGNFTGSSTPQGDGNVPAARLALLLDVPGRPSAKPGSERRFQSKLN